MSRRLMAVGLITAWGLAACGGSAPDAEEQAAPEAAAPEPLVVYTTNYPLAYFAERIGGGHVSVEFPAPAGVDPAYWSPDADVIASYQAADLILINGAGYEGWIARTSLPESKIVNTTEGLEDRYVLVEEAVVHTHGPEGEHEHQNVAFTTWLDPQMATEQARAVRDALAERRPEADAELQAALASLEEDLAELDAGLQAWADGLGGAPLFASHPVYQYAAARYDLNLRSVHFEPDEAPSASAWRELATLASAHPARVMLWEAQPLAETEARLRDEMGIASVVFDPSGSRPAEGDLLSVMRENVDRLPSR